MPNERFSELPQAVSATLADIICVTQSGVSYQETLQQVQDLLSSNINSFTWNIVTGTTQILLPNNGYICVNSGLTTLTLPAVCPFGKEFKVVNSSVGGFTISQNSGQSVQVGNVSTTSGSGSITSTAVGDNISFVCNVADLTFITTCPPQGNLIIV